MNMKLVQRLLLGGVIALALGLTGCADDGQDDLFLVVHPGHSNCESDDSVLDGAQCSVTELVDDLEAIFNDTPLEGFLACIDPLANDLVDGPDSVLQTLLEALANQSATPEEMEAAINDLATALASLGDNLPNALLALSGDNEAIGACVDGEGGGGGDPDQGQLDPFCAIPTIGPALVEGLGGVCP